MVPLFGELHHEREREREISARQDFIKDLLSCVVRRVGVDGKLVELLLNALAHFLWMTSKHVSRVHVSLSD